MQVKDPARDENQAQWIESRHQGNQVVPEQVTRVPLAATRVGENLPGIVVVVGRVVPANQDQGRQGVQRAVVVADAVVVVVVAVVVVVVADADQRYC